MTADVLGTPVQTPAWIPTDDTFGARLALVRQKMGWGNVKEAALACGLPPESWRTWERDNVTPRRVVQIARRIAERTGADYGWLLDGPRLAGVYRPTGQIVADVDSGRYVPPGTYGRPKSLSDQATPKVAGRTTVNRPGNPDRVRPRDNRPSSHPAFPVLPPTHRRPVPRPRVA